MRNLLDNIPGIGDLNATYSTNKDLDQIVNLVTYLDQTALDDKLELHTFAQTAIDAAEIAEFKEKHTNAIYCCKTGQLIAEFNNQTISQLLKTHNITKANEILQMQARNRVASHWLFTDSQSLDKLMETDPRGYFVFAASSMLSIFQIDMRNCNAEQKQVFMDKLHQIKITLFKSLAPLDIKLILQANEMMRRFLAITKPIAISEISAFKTVKLNEIAISNETIKELITGTQETIQNLIRSLFSKHKLKHTITYGDICNLKFLREGYSNFRGQKKLKGMTDTEHAMFLLEQFMPDKSAFQVELLAGQKYKETAKRGVDVVQHKGAMQIKPAAVTETRKVKVSFATALLRAKENKK